MSERTLFESEFRSGLIAARLEWVPPVSQGGKRLGGLSFGYFSLDKQRKVTRQQPKSKLAEYENAAENRKELKTKSQNLDCFVPRNDGKKLKPKLSGQETKNPPYG